MGKTTIHLPGRFYWKLVWHYDNSSNSAAIEHEYQQITTEAVSWSNFSSALIKVAKQVVKTEEINANATISYGLSSASIKASQNHSFKINTLASRLLETREDGKAELVNVERRLYTVGPGSVLMLYQRCFEAPGIACQLNVFQTTDAKLETDDEIVDIVVEANFTRYIKNLNVVTGGGSSHEPQNAVKEQDEGNNDINAKFGGAFVWLVPEYTYVIAEAATGFQFHVQDKADARYGDLAKGTGGDFRYITSIRETGAEKVVEVTLVRNGNGRWKPKPNWDKGHITSDINKGRGKDFLKLAWRTESA